jgi:hypothetical protein
MLPAAMIVAGVGAAAWGIPAAHRFGRPWDMAAALLVPLGVITAGLGVLLLIVPDFFSH